MGEVRGGKLVKQNTFHQVKSKKVSVNAPELFLFYAEQIIDQYSSYAIRRQITTTTTAFTCLCNTIHMVDSHYVNISTC